MRSYLIIDGEGHWPGVLGHRLEAGELSGVLLENDDLLTLRLQSSRHIEFWIEVTFRRIQHAVNLDDRYRLVDADGCWPDFLQQPFESLAIEADLFEVHGWYDVSLSSVAADGFWMRVRMERMGEGRGTEEEPVVRDNRTRNTVS